VYVRATHRRERSARPCHNKSCLLFSVKAMSHLWSRLPLTHPLSQAQYRSLPSIDRVEPASIRATSQATVTHMMMHIPTHANTNINHKHTSSTVVPHHNPANPTWVLPMCCIRLRLHWLVGRSTSRPVGWLVGHRYCVGRSCVRSFIRSFVRSFVDSNNNDDDNNKQSPTVSLVRYSQPASQPVSEWVGE